MLSVALPSIVALWVAGVLSLVGMAVLRKPWHRYTALGFAVSEMAMAVALIIIAI